MSEQQLVTPESVTQDMHELLRSMHENGYNNVDEIGRFIVLYEGRSDTLDPDDPDARTAFLESLDVPDIDLEFHEGIFDDIVQAYDQLGGDRDKLRFPDTGREVPKDWTTELAEISWIFSDDYRSQVGPLHPNVLHRRTIARYVREHQQQLSAEDRAEAYLGLISNPNFLEAFAEVCKYDEDELPTSRANLDKKYEESVFLRNVLDAVGYQTPDTYFQDWRREIEFGDELDIKHDIAPNVGAIAALEGERPGATRLLSSYYGIRHFSRYPLELLVEQVDTHGDATRPYGVVVSAVSDHNGAFSSSALRHSPAPIHQLYEQVKDEYGLRVCEAGTKKEFKERLAGLDSLYGDTEKIRFVVIQAHGSHDSIHLGGWANTGSIALTAKLTGVKTAFAPEASVLLDSCATGQINGVGQAISRRLGLTVVAPVESTGVGKVTFVADESGLRLVPRYEKRENFLDKNPTQVEAAVYRNGELLDAEATAAYLKTD